MAAAAAARRKKKPNWAKIRLEYETSNISQRKLAAKFDVSFSTLKDRANREDWQKGKEIVATKIATKIQQKAIERISDKIAYDISVELEAATLINQLILETLKDTKQFKKHLVTKKEKYANGKMAGYDEHGNAVILSEKQWVESQEHDVIDTKRLQAAAAALKTSNDIKRMLLNIIDADKQAKLDIDKQALELAKQKQKDDAGGDDDNETGIVVMPSVGNIEEGEDL